MLYQTLNIPPMPFTNEDTWLTAFIICPAVSIILFVSKVPSCDLNEFNMDWTPEGGR